MRVRVTVRVRVVMVRIMRVRVRAVMVRAMRVREWECVRVKKGRG